MKIRWQCLTEFSSFTIAKANLRWLTCAQEMVNGFEIQRFSLVNVTVHQVVTFILWRRYFMSWNISSPKENIASLVKFHLDSKNRSISQLLNETPNSLLNLAWVKITEDNKEKARVACKTACCKITSIFKSSIQNRDFLFEGAWNVTLLDRFTLFSVSSIRILIAQASVLLTLLDDDY